MGGRQVAPRCRTSATAVHLHQGTKAWSTSQGLPKPMGIGTRSIFESKLRILVFLTWIWLHWSILPQCPSVHLHEGVQALGLCSQACEGPQIVDHVAARERVGVWVG